MIKMLLYKVLFLMNQMMHLGRRHLNLEFVNCKYIKKNLYKIFIKIIKFIPIFNNYICFPVSGKFSQNLAVVF